MAVEGDSEFENVMLQQRARFAADLSQTADFQDCLERLLHLLDTELNAIFVDRSVCKEGPPAFPSDPIENRRQQQPQYPDSMHRAQVVAHMLNRTTGMPPFLEATARRSGVRKVSCRALVKADVCTI